MISCEFPKTIHTANVLSAKYHKRVCTSTFGRVRTQNSCNNNVLSWTFTKHCQKILGQNAWIPIFYF
eukprot:TRINITY_DN11059_c0_g1_i1.p1 TRINITY_DN11059_c0_g1~~TRINITY_DN11059_c0_g1_i1.p1  ORF type:complete len:67 (-),score=4.95 TRINITY_DN11059_c0_g1_i1:42-242(-)